MINKPAYGFTHAAFKGFLRTPAQFTLNFPGVNGIASIVARPVGNPGDQVAVMTQSGRFFRRQLFKQCAQCFYGVDIAPLVVPADIVGFPTLPAVTT